METATGPILTGFHGTDFVPAIFAKYSAWN